MYLLKGHAATDHNTIAWFRKDHLPYAVEDLLNQMVKLLVDCGEISLTFIPFLEKLCRKQPVKRVVVDSGYESEEKYHYIDGSEQLSLFVKPSNHEQKKKRKYKNGSRKQAMSRM